MEAIAIRLEAIAIRWRSSLLHRNKLEKEERSNPPASNVLRRCLSSRKPLELLNASLSFSLGGVFCCRMLCFDCVQKPTKNERIIGDVGSASRVKMHY